MKMKLEIFEENYCQVTVVANDVVLVETSFFLPEDSFERVAVAEDDDWQLSCLYYFFQNDVEAFHIHHFSSLVRRLNPGQDLSCQYSYHPCYLSIHESRCSSSFNDVLLQRFSSLPLIVSVFVEAVQLL